MPKFQGKLQLQFGPKVTKEQVHQAVEQIFRLSGCLACGLLGIDLRLFGGDPAVEQLSKLAGVAGVIATHTAE